MELNHKQMSGLRYYDAEDEYVTAPPHWRTARSLEQHGLIKADREREAYVLTSRGKELVRAYVSSTGNGPEDLKARLSFIGGGKRHLRLV